MEYVMMDLSAGNAVGNRGGAKILEPGSSSGCRRSTLRHPLFQLLRQSTSQCDRRLIRTVES